MMNVNESKAREIPRFAVGPRIEDDEFEKALAAQKSERLYLGDQLWMHKYRDSEGNVASVRIEGYQYHFEIYAPYCGNYVNGMDLRLLLAPNPSDQRHRVRSKDHVSVPVAELTEEQRIKYVKNPNVA